MRNVLFLVLILALLGCTRLEQAAPLAIETPQPVLEQETLSPAGVEISPTVAALPLSGPTLTATFPTILSEPTLTPTVALLTPSATSPWRRTRTPSPTPTITLTPTLDVTTRIPLRIVSPGPLSKVVSPIPFIVHITPDYTGLTRIELIGEDGRELYRKVFKTYSNIGYFTRVDEKITFQIPGAAEIARLQISTYDPKGNILAFNSVRLLLLSTGENQFTPPYPAQDRIGLRLKREAEIAGGTLNLEGEINPINDTPLIIELFDPDGRIVGSRLVQLAPADGKFQPFRTDIPYQVLERTPIRLVLRQSDDRISGLAYLYSLPIFLSP
ncbi:MAG: hypothetical protein DDG60_03765 [Anaerolineae bacterium]|nr:MAG: hypothetical protein DDG60_03765 [Anaerolineae bacterium]